MPYRRTEEGWPLTTPGEASDWASPFPAATRASLVLNVKARSTATHLGANCRGH